MIEDAINSLGDVSDIIPTEEEINKIIDKLNNDEELDFYDNLVLQRLRFCDYILRLGGKK